MNTTTSTDRELLEAAARKAGVLSASWEIGDTPAGLVIICRPLPDIWPLCRHLTMPELLRIVRAAAEAGEAERDALLSLKNECVKTQRAIETVGAERDQLAKESTQNFVRAREWAERAGALEAERDQLRAECERLRGLKPECPPRPPHHNGPDYQHPGLPRYGLRWNGPGEPIAVPMDDGYWTPFHLALETVEAAAEIGGGG